MKNKSFGQILARGLKSFENGKLLSLTDPKGWGSWLGSRNYTGQVVNIDTALAQTTVWAIVNLLAGTISTLPLFLNRQLPGGSKVPATDHELYGILKYRPNRYMTAVIFWRVFYLSLLLWGAAYVEIKRRPNGKVTSLDFLFPQNIVPRRLENGSVEWKYTDPISKSVRTIAPDNMWFCPFYTLDGITPISPIKLGANAIGGAIAADRAAAETFTGGMKSPGIVTMSAPLKDKQREEIREHVDGVAKSGGFMVLEQGTSFHALTINPQDAQLLETRQYSVAQICSWFGVNPTMIGQGSDKNSNWGTGLTQQKQGFVDFALRQFVVTVEASIREGLLTAVERLTYSAEWVFEGLLRGNPSERAGFYSTMTQNGVMTRDECRGLENLPLAGGNAAELTVQSNMLPIEKLGEGVSAADTAKNAIQSWLTTGETDDTPA